MGPPLGIDPVTHCTISKHSTTELHLVPYELLAWIMHTITRTTVLGVCEM